LDKDIRQRARFDLKQICSYCGAIDELQLDHIWPASRGGTNHIDNLTFACRRCNMEKRDKLPHQWRN
jgi:5-methylcytosine-specific restriction endonuclease McrA